MLARKTLLAFALLSASYTLEAQLAKPQIVSPAGPAAQFPQYIWTDVPGATDYVVTLHTMRHQCSPGGPVFSESSDEVAYVDQKQRCSHERCGFQAHPLSPGVSSPKPPYFGGYIHCTHDLSGQLVTFTWTVQARAGGTSSPPSDPSSYSLIDSPPPPPPPPPPQTSYVVTCVFKTGNNYWAWYNGVFTAFVNSNGQVTPGIIGKSFTFSQGLFQNCQGLVTGATPVPSASFVVNNIALCTNLVSGAQETFINATCPSEQDSKTPYKKIAIEKPSENLPLGSAKLSGGLPYLAYPPHLTQ
jgi:hypothetical protein